MLAITIFPFDFCVMTRSIMLWICPANSITPLHFFGLNMRAGLCSWGAGRLYHNIGVLCFLLGFFDKIKFGKNRVISDCAVVVPAFSPAAAKGPGNPVGNGKRGTLPRWEGFSMQKGIPISVQRRERVKRRQD